MLQHHHQECFSWRNGQPVLMILKFGNYSIGHFCSDLTLRRRKHTNTWYKTIVGYKHTGTHACACKYIRQTYFIFCLSNILTNLIVHGTPLWNWTCKNVVEKKERLFTTQPSLHPFLFSLCSLVAGWGRINPNRAEQISSRRTWKTRNIRCSTSFFLNRNVCVCACVCVRACIGVCLCVWVCAILVRFSCYF